MDHPLTIFGRQLIGNLQAFNYGAPQQSGPLTVLPLIGPDDRRIAPMSSLKLGGVKRGYGNVELRNASKEGVCIIPLHMGYIQDGAQNHALCRAAFLSPGQRSVFEDACCVQQSQGGYLEDRDQWFFVLPLQLREEALRLRGTKSYGKLWPAISALNKRFELPDRGHLEQIVCRSRPYLNQYRSRFELLEGQTGAMFFLDDCLAGVEIAPSVECFRQLWMPLVCFCYGVAAMEMETIGGVPQVKPSRTRPFDAQNLAELRQNLVESRWERQLRLREPAAYGLKDGQAPAFKATEEERQGKMRLATLISENFCGQVVEEGGNLIYASISARQAWLNLALGKKQAPLPQN
jgi:hypothetical protein